MIPTSARAAVVTEFGQPLELREYPVLPPEPGGLLVRMETASVCGTDVHFWLGHAGRVRPPVIPGHEGVGRVVQIGSGADRDSRGREVRIGDRVIWGHATCGSCHACTTLRDETLCEHRYVGMLVSPERPPHLHATFAEYAHVHPRAGRIVVPSDVASDLASAVSCAGRSVLAAFDRCGPVDSRHTVLIQGAGALGLFATAVAAARGARAIIVIGDPDDRLAAAAAFGADAVISVAQVPEAADRAAMVRDRTRGRGADVVFEFAGVAGAMAEGIELAAPGARYVMSGTLDAPPAKVSAASIIAKNLTVRGSLGATIGHYGDALDVAAQTAGRFPWQRMLGPGRYALHEVHEALRAGAEARDIKPIIEIGPGR